LVLSADVHALLLAAALPALLGAIDLPPEMVGALKRSVVHIKGVDAMGGKLGSGSGFVVDASGVVATNRHVVEKAGSQLVVEFSDGTERKVRSTLIIHDTRDVALVRIDGEGYPVMKLGSSLGLVEGTPITMIGGPLGLAWTFSPGTLSALREHGLDEDFRGSEEDEFDKPGSRLLQCEVTGAPGASGSPVVNGAGEVVGIIASGISGPGAITQIMFAVPVEAVKEAMERASGGAMPLSAATGVDRGQRTRLRNLGASLVFFAALGLYAVVRRRRAAPPRKR
jgi:S1-C subfamily serine protease